MDNFCGTSTSFLLGVTSGALFGVHAKKKGWLSKEYEGFVLDNDSKKSTFNACFCNCCGAFKKSRECEYCGVIE